MNEILHLLWQINFKRDPKESLVLLIRHVDPLNNIAGEIRWGNKELSFGSYTECITLLERFEKGILI